MSRPIDGAQGGLATHGVCAPCKFLMADLMERQGVMRAVHRARRKKLSRHGARARFDKLNTGTSTRSVRAGEK
jgi:hypothetical protein